MLTKLGSRLSQAAMQRQQPALKSLVATQLRGIKLHEYQAGALLDSFRVKIPLGEVAFSAEECEKIAATMPGGCVVKSQILGGGRGRGHIKESGYQGGVKVVATPAQAKLSPAGSGTPARAGSQPAARFIRHQKTFKSSTRNAYFWGGPSKPIISPTRNAYFQNSILTPAVDDPSPADPSALSKLPAK